MTLTKIIKWFYIIFFSYQWYQTLLWIYISKSYSELSHFDKQEVYSDYIFFGSYLLDGNYFYLHGVFEAAISIIALVALVSQNNKMEKVEYALLLVFGLLAGMLNVWQIL